MLRRGRPTESGAAAVGSRELPRRVVLVVGRRADPRRPPASGRDSCSARRLPSAVVGGRRRRSAGGVLPAADPHRRPTPGRQLPRDHAVRRTRRRRRRPRSGLRDRGPGLPRAALRLRGRSQRTGRPVPALGHRRARGLRRRPGRRAHRGRQPHRRQPLPGRGPRHRRPGSGRHRDGPVHRAGPDRQAARDRRPARRPLRRRHAGPDHAVVPRRVRGRVHHRRIRPAHQRLGDGLHVDDG